MPDASRWCKSKHSSLQNKILKYFDGIHTSSSEQILRGEKQHLQFLRHLNGLPSLRNPGQSFAYFPL